MVKWQMFSTFWWGFAILIVDCMCINKIITNAQVFKKHLLNVKRNLTKPWVLIKNYSNGHFSVLIDLDPACLFYRRKFISIWYVWANIINVIYEMIFTNGGELRIGNHQITEWNTFLMKVLDGRLLRINQYKRMLEHQPNKHQPPSRVSCC